MIYPFNFQTEMNLSPYLLNMKKRNIDHIVYAVPDLEFAIDDLEKRTGVRPVLGGTHTSQGTKNALLNLGNTCYLEILSTDKNNVDIKPPRWMGIDLIDRPTISRWSLKSSDLQKDSTVLQKYHSDMGTIHAGQRKMTNGQLLTWEMMMPLSNPKVEVIPFMTDWQQSVSHPTDQLSDDCQICKIQFIHPEPKLINMVFYELDVNIKVAKGASAAILLEIQTPNGIVIL